MKVYYVNSELQGCYNVRCLLPLQANAWDGDRTSFLTSSKTPEFRARGTANAEIVVFHRPQDKMRVELAKILQKNGKKIVFDNDDTVKDDGGFKFNEFMDKDRLEKGLKTLNEYTDEFLSFADLVTCSTEFLAEEYRKINPNVVVLPNCVDPFYFDKPLRNEGEKIRIGITGSVAITSDLEVLEPILAHYKDDPRVQLVLFSMPPQKNDIIMRELYKDEYDYWESMPIEWQPFVPAEDYYRTLNELRLDMVIIPRADNYFNRCKSNLKFLENSMLGIPTIAQSFPTGDSPYQQNPKDREYLLLAGNTEEFINQIEYLINNPEERIELGKKAYNYVKENYDITKNAHKWKEAYQTILK